MIDTKTKNTGIIFNRVQSLDLKDTPDEYAMTILSISEILAGNRLCYHYGMEGYIGNKVEELMRVNDISQSYIFPVDNGNVPTDIQTTTTIISKDWYIYETFIPAIKINQPMVLFAQFKKKSVMIFNAAGTMLIEVNLSLGRKVYMQREDDEPRPLEVEIELMFAERKFSLERTEIYSTVAHTLYATYGEYTELNGVTVFDDRIDSRTTGNSYWLVDGGIKITKHNINNVKGVLDVLN